MCGAEPPNESAVEPSATADGRPESVDPADDPVAALFTSLGSWPGVLGRLARGSDLDADEAAAALGDVLAGNATPSQIAAFVFGLRCKGETVEEMTGLVRAMLAAAEIVSVGDVQRARLVDTCGTGGDRSGTINVSTIAALVLAGAGVPVCKHGGRASSSRAGSADVLEALGVAIDLGPGGVRRCIDEVGIGFCFAPRYHPAMRHAASTRRELGVPTAFNFLGPLANPARLGRQVVGVGDSTMATKVCAVLAASGSTHVMVVYGSDGLDELTTTGPSTVVEWIADCDPDPDTDLDSGADRDPGLVVDAPGRRLAGRMTTTSIDPADLGLAPSQPSDLVGGDVATNAARARAILGGEPGPQRDIVVLNAAAGLVVGGVADHLASGLAIAAAALDDGRALAILDRLVAVSNDSR